MHAGDKIKVVNAEAGELSLLSTIIRRHGRIQSEGWERHMTWCYHCQPTGRHTRIQETNMNIRNNGKNSVAI